MSFPWPLIAAALLGLFVVFLPTFFHICIESTAADTAHLCGALVITVSVICMGEVVRVGRYLNILLALVIAIVPMVVETPLAYRILCTVAAVCICGLSIPRGSKTENYGSWDRYII